MFFVRGTGISRGGTFNVQRPTSNVQRPTPNGSLAYLECGQTARSKLRLPQSGGKPPH
jgi:hypothetical protein